MSDLSPELRQLFRATGIASRPTLADRERVFVELQGRLGVAATAGAGTFGTVGTASRTTARVVGGKAAVIAGATVLLVVAGVASLRTMTHRQVPEVQRSSTVSVVDSSHSVIENVNSGVLAATGATTTDVVAGNTEIGPKTAVRASMSRPALRERDSLTEEAKILSRAQSELNNGQADKALRVLAEHQKRFRRGILAQERTAVRIQALCALGRVSEANALLSGMSRQSLSGESARQACSSSISGAARR